MIEPGDKVRLIANPSRIGLVGNETDGPPHRKKVLVHFLDGDEQYVPLGALEKVEAKPQGPYALISAGRYGGVEDLRGLMTYYRLSGKLANLIYSLNSTNTQFLAYQFKPVLNFLASPCNGILIADEVGLGKTIEAGLIWTELRARQDAKRLLVVCPAMLREKWKMELSDRFGVQANIVDSAELFNVLSALKDRPQQSFALISSMQGLRPAKSWNDEDEPSNKASAKLARLLDQAELENPLLDLVIIDEAHYLRNRDTQTNKLGELLRPVTQNLVLLSATPIQLRSSDLFNLLHLLDEDAFPYEYSFEQTLQSNAPIVHLRDNVLNSVISQHEFIDQLKSALDFRIFDDNEQIEFLLKNPPSDEYLSSPNGRAEMADKLDRINPLAKVITRTLKRDVQEFRVQRMPVPIRVRMSEMERDFYDAVTNEVRSYCESIDISTGFMLTIPQRQMSSCMAAACRGWAHKLDEAQENEINEIAYENYGQQDIESSHTPKLGTLLTRLIMIARRTGDFSVLQAADSKFNAFFHNLKLYWEQNPGKKVVLFAFYRMTLKYLEERLKQHGIASVVVYGGIDKQEALKHFENPNGPNILLSSEVASEGVDLQFSSLLINYDLPWNPMRIEQRIGRIDRIGQEADQILIWNFVYEDSIDEKIYDRLLERLNIFKQALGSLEAILGDEIRQLGYELLSHKLTKEQEIARIDRASVAIQTLNRQQEALESEATQLIAHGEFIQSQVSAARDLGRYIRGEDLLAYVQDYLVREYPGTRFIPTSTKLLEFQIELSTEARVRFSDFLTSQHLLGASRLLQSNPPIMRFENVLGKVPNGIERITQQHPLVRFVANQIKSSAAGIGYFPVSAIEIPAYQVSGFKPGIYIYAVARWTVSGSREIERLEYIAMNLAIGDLIIGDAAEQLVNNAAMLGKNWLAHYNNLLHQDIANHFDDCKFELERRFKDFAGDCMREDRDRINLMVSLLQSHLATQKNRILERIKHYELFGTEKQKRLIPAERGRLNKLSMKLNERIAELKLKEKAEVSESFVSGGVVYLT